MLVGCLGEGVVAEGSSRYQHGQILKDSAAADTLSLTLPPKWALQHPGDWVTSASAALTAALAAVPPPPRETTPYPHMYSPEIAASEVVSIGVDFTSCTMVPVDGDRGTPLCEAMPERPHAWPKLWKHHGAARQAQTLTDLAVSRGEKWVSERCASTQHPSIPSSPPLLPPAASLLPSPSVDPQSGFLFLSSWLCGGLQLPSLWVDRRWWWVCRGSADDSVRVGGGMG